MSHSVLFINVEPNNDGLSLLVSFFSIFETLIQKFGGGSVTNESVSGSLSFCEPEIIITE